MTSLALDLAIGGVILLSTLISYFRGIVREFFTLAGFSLAVFVSYKGGHLLVPGVGEWLHVMPDSSQERPTVLGLLTPTKASYFISYGSVFLLMFVLMIVIKTLVTRWIAEAGLTVVDRLAGASFGFLRGFLLVFIVYATCAYLIGNDRFPDWVKNSYSVPVLEGTFTYAKQHLNLDQFIKDEGKGVTINLNKIDIDKLGKDTGDAAKDLKDDVKKEEQQMQKSQPDTPPAPVPEAPAPVPAPDQSSAPPQPPAAAAPETPSPAPSEPPAPPAPVPPAPATPDAPPAQ